MSTTFGLWPKRFGWLNVPGVALMVLAASGCTDSRETPTSIEPISGLVSTQGQLAPTSSHAGPESVEVPAPSPGKGNHTANGGLTGARATPAPESTPPRFPVSTSICRRQTFWMPAMSGASTSRFHMAPHRLTSSTPADLILPMWTVWTWCLQVP